MMNQIEASRTSYDAPCTSEISGMQKEAFSLIMKMTDKQIMQVLLAIKEVSQ